MDDFSIKFPVIEVMDAAAFRKELDLDKLISKEVANALTRIKNSTTAGQTAEGGSLREYSPGYKRMRAAAGLSTKTNLTVTQELLRSMVVKSISTATQIGSSISFEGSHAPAKPLKVSSGGRQTRQATGEKKAKSPKRSSLISGQAKSLGGGVAPRSSGGGESMPNASLAQDLYARGFVGWFTLSSKDTAIIQTTVSAAIGRALKRLFTTKDRG